MASIDTSKIDGFDGMSADDKVKALLSYQIPDPVDMSAFVARSVLDEKSTEAAELSRQLKKAKEAQDKLTATESELAALKRNYYVASKGLTGDEAEFVAFKASKMVNDKTTFEQAVDQLTKDHKPAGFDWTGSIGGGEKKPDTNSQMNALIRGAFK